MVIALDVVIGLIFFYLLISLLCTGINEFIAGLFRLRARTLYAEIRKLIDNPEIHSDFWNSGLVRALCRDCDDERHLSAQHRPELEAKHAPSYMDSSIFALALLQAIKALPGSREDGKRLSEKVPEGSLLKSAVREIETAIGSDSEDVRVGLAKMFDAAMERTSGVYRRTISWISLAVALVAVSILNADTIGMAKVLAKENVLRQQIVAAADDYLNDHVLSENGEQSTANPQADIDNKAHPADLEHSTLAIARINNKLSEFPLGWSGPYGSDSIKDILSTFHKIAGLFITAFAASFGADFWFNALKQISQIRNAVYPVQKRFAPKTDT